MAWLNLKEDITGYYGVLLAKMMFDLQVPSDATYGKHNSLSGTRNDLVVTLPTLYPADLTDISGSVAVKTSGLKLSVNQVNSGYRISGDAGMAINGTCSQAFALNLISLIGSLGSAR
jgi:hypothetical protein